MSMRLEGGLPIGPDGRVHTTFMHQPVTLRLSSGSPAMQNIPRGSTELGKLIRGFFVTAEGYIFWARDFSGIEGVLVGFFANAPRIIRIFQLDGHSYFTAYAIYELEKGLISYQDLPQEAWSDADLKLCLKAIKKRFGERRNVNKKITHGANYVETAKMAQFILLNELGVLWPVKEISKVMEFYHSLFPEVRRWHQTVIAEVGGVAVKGQAQRWGFTSRNCQITNPFGFTVRYYDVLKWEKTPGGWDWSMGEDAKKLISFLPQSSARFILTRAAQRIWDNAETRDVADTFRLFIHDELLGECRNTPEQLDRCLQVSREEFERPIPELAMPDGSFLSLGSEPKVGRIWGEMS